MRASLLTFKVKVPAGVQQESKLRLKGHGLPDGPRGKRGDILVKIAVQIPKKLSREQKKAVKALAEVGFSDPEARKLTLGVTWLYTARRRRN